MHESHDDFDAVLEAASKLSYEEKQALVTQLTSMLQQSEVLPVRKRKSLYGIWKDSPPITDEDIREVREEMWRNFPREDIV